MKCKRIKRFVWTPKPTEVFLDLWQTYAAEFRSPRKNMDIYREIAEKMFEFDITHVEIKAKVDNMTKKYRLELNRCSDEEPSEWVYFKKVQEILCESRPIKGSLVMANSLDFSPFEDSDGYDSDIPDLTEVPGQKYSTVVRSSTVSPTSVQSAACVQREYLQENETPAQNKSQTSIENVFSTTSESQVPRKRPDSVRSDSSYSMTTCRPSSERAERLLAIEEEKLALQKENLRALKNIADELSSAHRDFLQVYKYSFKNKHKNSI